MTTEHPNLQIDTTIFPKDSFLHLLLKYSNEVTDAPDQFIITSGIVGISTVLGNKVWYEMAGSRLNPNLWAIKIAHSSELRKSTSDNIIINMIYEFAPELIAENETSPEQFIADMDGLPCKLITFPEMGGVLKRMQNSSYMVGFKAILTNLYDYHVMYTRKLRKDHFVVKNPALSLLGSSTLDWFEDGCTKEDLQSGFLYRALFSLVKESVKEKMYITGTANEELKKLLITHLETIKENWEGPKQMTKGAEKIYIDWCKKIDNSVSEIGIDMFHSFFDRLQKSVVKIALGIEGMLRTTEYLENKNSKFNNSQYLSKESLEIAITLGEYFRHSIVLLITKEMSYGKLGYLEKRITNLLEENGGKMTKRKLQQMTGLDSHALIRNLDAMQKVGYLTHGYIKQDSGQTSHVVEIVNENSNDTSAPSKTANLLAEILLREIKKQNQQFKCNKGTLFEWAYEIDRMIKEDKRDQNEIQRIILYAHNIDIFWKNVVINAKALSRNFDQLYVKWKNDENKSDIDELFQEISEEKM
jgi:hypothetical protein